MSYPPHDESNPPAEEQCQQPAAPGYPSQPTPGYPSQPAPGSPNQPAPGYPSESAAGYPSATPGYPPAAGGYPPAAGAFPPVEGSYPPPTEGSAPYPPAGGIPPYPSYLPQGTGTVKEKPDFDGKKEAEILRKAMKGIGTDEKAIISVLTSCSCAQRQKIIADFKDMYDKREFTRESIMLEILCSRLNSEIADIKKAYRKAFSRSLEKDVVSETSGRFRKLLEFLCQAQRNETNYVDILKAKADAKALYDEGEKEWSSDESKFNEMMAWSNYDQLRTTFDEYGKLAEYNIEEGINKALIGEPKNGILTVVECALSVPKFFARKLYESMKGLGTGDDTLIRIVVSRCEIDMVEIKQEFEAQYNETLAKFIEGDCSGDYKRILLALIK